MKRSPIKRRKRSASETKRVYGGKARIEFVKSLPCLAEAPDACLGPIANHHVETGGMGRKSDAKNIVPLCQWHHGALHHYGRDLFEYAYKIDLSRAAAETERLWQEHLARGE